MFTIVRSPNGEMEHTTSRLNNTLQYSVILKCDHIIFNS